MSTSLKKVVLFGPESTGKTELARELAQELSTLWVPEFARWYLDLKQEVYDPSMGGANEICQPHDIPHIVLGQIATEDSLAEQARGILICDTNLVQTMVYVKHYYQNRMEWLDRLIEKRHYDLYLLTGVDIPWVPDPPHRDRPNNRDEMYALFEKELIDRGLPYAKVFGSGKQRLDAALTHIKNCT